MGLPLLPPSPRHRDLARYVHDDNFDREHHGRITNGRHPADLVDGAAKWSPDQPHLSAQLRVRSA
jgi:hypothetical protein